MILDDTHGEITISAGAHIEDSAIIIGPAYIGPDAYIGHGAVIGAPPQYRGVYPSPVSADRADKGVHISKGACVRELAQVHQGIIDETVIGYDTLIMAGCHIAHDTAIGRDCTIGSFSVFGGHTTVCDRVTFGQGVVTHPWVVIGESAMIGLNSSVINDIAPFQKVAGSPARIIGKNTGASGKKEVWRDSVLDAPTWERYAAAQHTRDAAKELPKGKND